MTAEQWANPIIDITWKYITAIWKQQNEETFGSMEMEKNQRKKKKIINEILKLKS
jgi:cyclopropane fatty-acyl-phospholipid synthase-like methyltransferase